MTTIKGEQSKKPDLTVTINRTELEQVMGGKATFDALIGAGKARFDGDRKAFEQLRSTIVQFAPDFELMPGTKPTKAPPLPKPKDPFEVIQSDTKGVP
jgi:linear primary-alkylsulfatase